MELWIRSQDKQKLIKSEYIEYGEWNKEHRIYVYGEIFAKYKTKERALEVLDEIQNKLLKSKYDKASEGYGKHSDCRDTLIEISSSSYVYEMPKE